MFRVSEEASSPAFSQYRRDISGYQASANTASNYSVNSLASGAVVGPGRHSVGPLASTQSGPVSIDSLSNASGIHHFIPSYASTLDATPDAGVNMDPGYLAFLKNQYANLSQRKLMLEQHILQHQNNQLGAQALSLPVSACSASTTGLPSHSFPASYAMGTGEGLSVVDCKLPAMSSIAKFPEPQEHHAAIQPRFSGSFVLSFILLFWALYTHLANGTTVWYPQHAQSGEYRLGEMRMLSKPTANGTGSSPLQALYMEGVQGEPSAPSFLRESQSMASLSSSGQHDVISDVTAPDAEDRAHYLTSSFAAMGLTGMRPGSSMRGSHDSLSGEAMSLPNPTTTGMHLGPDRYGQASLQQQMYNQHSPFSPFAYNQDLPPPGYLCKLWYVLNINCSRLHGIYHTDVYYKLHAAQLHPRALAEELQLVPGTAPG
jgi:hypothetical protein